MRSTFISGLTYNLETQFIYSHVILPWFLKNETKIDAAFDKAQKMGQQGLTEAEQLAKQAAADALTSKND